MPRITYTTDDGTENVTRSEWDVDDDGFVHAYSPEYTPEKRVVIPRENIVTIRYPHQ